MEAPILLCAIFLGVVSSQSKIGVKLCIDRCSNTGKCSSVQFDQTHLQCRLLWTGSFPDQSEYMKNKIDVKANTNPSLNCERDHRIVTTAWGKVVCLKDTVRIDKRKVKCKPKTSRPHYNKKSRRCVKGCYHFSHQFTIFRNSKTYDSSYEKVKAASLSDCRNACVTLRKFTCVTFSCSERKKILFSNDCYLGKLLPSRLKKPPPISYSIETKWSTGVRDCED